MRWCVTGAAGFIGSNLCHELIKRGESVIGVDDRSRGFLKNVDPILHKMDFVWGNLCDLQVAKDAISDCDYVLHQAAHGSVPMSIAYPEKTCVNNINSTINVLVAAREYKVKRLVNASSASCYGNRSDKWMMLKNETMDYLPENPYACSKVSAEIFVRDAWKTYELPTISLRYFNVFGPRQNPHSLYSAVIPKFIKSILQDGKIKIYGDGEQTRDFTFVSNVVHANILSATKDIPDKWFGDAFNLGTGDKISLNRLVDTIEEYTGRVADRSYTKPRQGDIKHSFGDLSKIEQVFGYKPICDFEDGICQTVDWIKNNA